MSEALLKKRSPERTARVWQTADFQRSGAGGTLFQPRVWRAGTVARFAVQSLLKDSVPQVESIPLGKLRGQIYNYRGIPVVVTYHPAYLLRSLAEKAKAWADLCLALGRARRPQD